MVRHEFSKSDSKSNENYGVVFWGQKTYTKNGCGSKHLELNVYLKLCVFIVVHLLHIYVCVIYICIFPICMCTCYVLLEGLGTQNPHPPDIALERSRYH